MSSVRAFDPKHISRNVNSIKDGKSALLQMKSRYEQKEQHCDVILHRKMDWIRGRFLSVHIWEELSTCCFRKRKNREVKAVFGSAVMRWCPTQQITQWTRSEGFSYSAATALLLAFDWDPCAPCTCALPSCLFGLLGRRLQAISLYMWIPAVAESYKKLLKKKAYTPPPPIWTSSDGSINTFPRCSFTEQPAEQTILTTTCRQNLCCVPWFHDWVCQCFIHPKSKSF